MRRSTGGSLTLVVIAPPSLTSTARLCASPMGNELHAVPYPRGPGHEGVPKPLPMLRRCAVRTGPERSSSPPNTRWTTPNEPLHGLLLLKLFGQVTPGGEGADGKFVSRLTIQVTVIGHGPAVAGTLI